jgi:hypothetical protein
MKTVFIVHTHYENILPYNTYVFETKEKAKKFLQTQIGLCDRTDSIVDAIETWEQMFPRRCLALFEYQVN